VAFADPAYRRVAGHGANRVRREADQRDTSTASRGNGRRFAPRMPSTDNDNIEPNHDAS